MTKTYTRLAFALSGLLAATGCAASSSENDAAEMKTISIAVSQWPSLGFAVPYHVALDQGYFADEGIEIDEIIAGSGGGTTIRSVLAGDLAFGEVATSALIESRKAGSPLVAVGGGSQQVGEVVWVAPANSSLESIEDLEGKVVGFTNPGSVTQSALAIALDRSSVDIDAVEQMATGGVSEGLTAMEGGAVDATIHSDPLYAAAADDYTLLWRSTDYITDYQQTVIVADPSFAAEDPELVTSFLTARAKAIEFMKSNPDEAAAIWSEGGEVPLEAAKQTLENLNKVEQWNVGFNAEGLTTAEEGMHAADLLEDGDSIKWSEYIDQDYLPEGVEIIDLP